MVPATLSWSVTNAQKCQLKNFKAMSVGNNSYYTNNYTNNSYYFVSNDTQEIDLVKEEINGVYSDKSYGEMPTTGSRTYMITCYGL